MKNNNDKNLEKIQETLMENLNRLNDTKDNINEEVARSNAISQLANTYIKTCNLIIRVEESKTAIKNKINNISE